MTSAITTFRTLLTATAIAAGSVVPIGSASADAHCPPVQVLGIPGTFYYHKPGEAALDLSRPGAMISQVADMLAAERAEGRIGYEQLAHPADIGAVVSYRQSNAIGVALTKQRVSAIAATCPGTRIALVGYSNGAGVAGDVLRDIGAGKGPVGADRIAGGFLISDPRRASSDNLVGPPVSGVGVDLPRSGGFGAVADRTNTFCAAGDLVCDNEPNATLLRPLMQRFATTANVSFVSAVMRAMVQNGLDLKKWACFVDEPNELSLLVKAATTLQRVESYIRLDNHAYYNDLRLNIGGRTATQWVADKIRGGRQS